MLRSIPSKLGGVLVMFGSILFLFFLPAIAESSKVEKFQGVYDYLLDNKKISNFNDVFYDLIFFF